MDEGMLWISEELTRFEKLVQDAEGGRRVCLGESCDGESPSELVNSKQGIRRKGDY